MAVISSIIAGISAAGAAIASAASAAAAAIGTAFSAIGGFLSTSLIGGSIALAPTTAGVGTVAAIGTTGGLTIGGALAGIGMASMAALSLGTMYSSARANAQAQNDQINAMKQQLSNNEVGQLEINDTAKTIQENTRMKRTLSSLRVPLGITPPQNTEQITQNVYGVDTNTVATATQNMTGLNIATA